MTSLVRGLVLGLLLAATIAALTLAGLLGWAAWRLEISGPLVPAALLLAGGLGALMAAGRLLGPPSALRAAAPMVVLFAATALVCLAVLEIGLRLLSPATTYEKAKRRSPPIFAPSSVVPFVLKPGYRGPTMSRETGEVVDLSINSRGYREPEFPVRKPPGTVRILVLGDSFAANVAIADEDLYTVVLERLLNERVGDCRVEVINAGWANGSSPDAYAAYMLDSGFALEPDLVLMQYFVLNDFKDLLENEVLDWQGDLPRRVRSKARYVDADGRLRRVFDVKYRIPLLRESHLFIHVWTLFDLEPASLEIASLFFDDFAVDNFFLEADGITQTDVFAEADSRPPELQRALERSLEYVRALARETRRRGADFVLFLVPAGEQLSKESWQAVFDVPAPDRWKHPNPQREIAERLAPAGVQILDPIRRYREEDETTALYLGEHRNGHWTRAGNAFTAELLRDFLLGPSGSLTDKCRPR